MTDEQPKTFTLTEEELRRLVASAVSEAAERGGGDAPGGDKSRRNFWDKFWDRLSSISTFVGSVVLGAVALMFNSNYNAQQAEERKAQFHFEQQKFIADERERQRRIVIELSPKIFSGEQKDRQGGQALLSHFFPGEAPHIIHDLADDYPDSHPEVGHVIAQAEREAAESGGWGVTFGHDDSLEAANDEVRKAEGRGFTAAVYKRGKWFVAVALGRHGEGAHGEGTHGFSSEVDAESANYVVRSAIREGSHVVNLKEWCRNPQQQSGYVQCSNN